MSAPTLLRVSPGQWRDACLEVHAAGGEFEALFALPTITLYALFRFPGETRAVICEPGPDGVRSLVDVIPACGWDEREAHDLYGIAFDGHEPLRPLLDHTASLDAWTVPVEGDDIHQVAVGPIHAGVIESGHFRFHVVGERIIHLDAQLFYKRRGLERAARESTLANGIAYAQRLCGACAVSNSLAYALAAESLLGFEAGAQLRRERTILLELERVYNHLNDISAVCAGVGFAAGTMTYAALKERAQRLGEKCCGHRFLFDTVKVGRSGRAFDTAATAELRQQLDGLGRAHANAWRELQFARSFQDRLDGVGVLSREDAIAMGAVGPSARAAGVATDVRCDSPTLDYRGFTAAVTANAGGDVQSRLIQRARELEQSFTLLDRLLGAQLTAASVTPAGGPATITAPPPSARGAISADSLAPPARGATSADGSGRLAVGRVESPRGRTVIALTASGGVLTGMHVRTGSFANWPVLAHTVAGNLLPDFPLINKSFELCYACTDR